MKKKGLSPLLAKDKCQGKILVCETSCPRERSVLQPIVGPGKKIGTLSLDSLATWGLCHGLEGSGWPRDASRPIANIIL